MLRTIASGLVLPCLLLAGSHGLQGQTVTPVPKLDLNAVTGAWYEVARNPNRGEKHCVGEPMEVIAKGNKPNKLQLVHTCQAKGGFAEVRNGTITRAKKAVDGKLKVSYIWPFSTKYWVLALGSEDQWALVGSPNHKDLWVLSRTAGLRPELLTEIEGRATAQGFSVAKLVVTSQAVRR